MVLFTEKNVGYRSSEEKTRHQKHQTGGRKYMKQYRMRIDGIEKDVLRTMNKLRKENGGEQCDVVLISMRKFYAHKIVLSSCSEYFRRHFEESESGGRKNTSLTGNDASFGSTNDETSTKVSDLSCGENSRSNRIFSSREKREKGDANKEIVILPGIPPQLLAVVLDYMYTSELVLGSKNVNEILCVGCLLQIDSVINLCAEVLLKQPEWKSPLVSLESLKCAIECSRGKLSRKKGSLNRSLAPTTVTWATGGIRPSSSTRCISDKMGSKLAESDISTNTSGAESHSDKEKTRRTWSGGMTSSRNNRKGALTARGLSLDGLQIADRLMPDACTESGIDLSTQALSSGDYPTRNVKRRERSSQEMAKRRKMSSDANEAQKINPDELKKEILHNMATLSKTDLLYCRGFSFDKEPPCGVGSGKHMELGSNYNSVQSSLNSSRKTIENVNSYRQSAQRSVQEKVAKTERWSAAQQDQKRNARKKRTRCISEVVRNTNGSLPEQDGVNCQSMPDRNPISITPPANFRSSSSGIGKAEDPVRSFGVPVQHVIRTDYPPFLHYYPQPPFLQAGAFGSWGIQQQSDGQNYFLRMAESQYDMQLANKGESQVYIQNVPNPSPIFVPHFDKTLNVIPNRWDSYSGTVTAIYPCKNNPQIGLSPQVILDSKRAQSTNRLSTVHSQSGCLAKDGGKDFTENKERERRCADQHPGLMNDNLSPPKVGYRPWMKRASSDSVTETAKFLVTGKAASEHVFGDVGNDRSQLKLDRPRISVDQTSGASIQEKKSRTAQENGRERRKAESKRSEISNSQAPSYQVPKNEEEKTRKYTEHHRRKRKYLPTTLDTAGECKNKKHDPNLGQVPSQTAECSSKDDITTRDFLDVSDPESDDSGRPSSV